jgi:pimeloyl-ACP methyl ester carboxylesterase
MPNVISHIPQSSSHSAKHYLIFFITGNPGLVHYYDEFLGSLALLLSSASPYGANFHIFAQSLAGFEDDDSDSHGRRGPYSLQEQIGLSFERLKSQAITSGTREGEFFDGIILIGHSVGAYILLEMLCLARQQLLELSSRISGGILLFPTVTHIAQSPSGVIMSALCRIPNFPWLASGLVKGLLWPFSEAVLQRVVRLVTGMPDHAAVVTTGFLQSKQGIWQALHMARDEMWTITEDRWNEDVWGVEKPQEGMKRRVPKLVFYFGENVSGCTLEQRDTDGAIGSLGS